MQLGEEGLTFRERERGGLVKQSEEGTGQTDRRG